MIVTCVSRHLEDLKMSFAMRFSGGFLWRIKLVIFSMVLYHVKLVNSQDLVIPAADFTPQGANPIAVKGIAATLKFVLKIKNAAAAAAGNNIAAAPNNYDVDFYFAYTSVADIAATTRRPIPKSGTNPALNFALLGTASSNVLTFTTTATLPSVNCNLFVFFCGCVKRGTGGTLYTETPTNNNCACKDASALIACSPDIVVGTFYPTAGTYPTFVKSTAGNLANFRLSIKNNAAILAGNQIAISTTTDNYKVNVYLAQDDLATSPGALKTAAYPATLATGDLRVGLAAGATTSLQTLNANGITLPNADCNKYTWLCAEVVKVVGAQYIDAITNNNYQCKDATAKISCPSDIVLTNFKPKSTNPIALKNTATTLQFGLKIQNKAAAGSDIASVAANSRNYDVDFYLSQADLTSTAITGTLTLATVHHLTNTVEPTASLNIALAGTVPTPLLQYSASATLPTADCNKYVLLCGCVRKGAAANYIDAVTNNNCQCKDATKLISCSPDITVINFDPSAGTFPVFNTLVGKDLIDFKVDVKNSAPVVAGNQIKAAATGNNYEIEIFMATDDLAVTPTATAAGPFAATLTSSGDLKVALAPGASTPPSLVMNATGIKLPALLNCNDYKWICACVKKGTGAQYIDEITDNNCQCADASKKSKIDCPIDVLLDQMTLTVPYMKTATATTIRFSVDLKNDDNANDITASTGLNFECIMRFAATDIGSGAPPLPDNLATPKKSFNSECIPGDPNLKSGLNSKKKITLKGSCDMTLTNAQCKEAKYLCLDCKSPSVAPGGSATYTDKITNNNIMCDRIDSKLTCDIDISLEATNINDMCTKLLPDPFLPGVNTSVLITKLTVKNDNPKSPGSALNDIKANTDNFDFEVMFSSVGTVPITQVGNTVPNVAAWNDALKATKTNDRDQSITFQMTDADCPTITYICLKVKAGTGAVFNELLTNPAELNDNTKCCSIAAKKQCKIDPQLTTSLLSFNPAVDDFELDKAVTTVIDVSLQNAGPGDIAGAAGTGGVNFKFVQYFAAGDHCTNPGASTSGKCSSTIQLGSPSQLDAALPVYTSPGDENKFKIGCSMTLTVANCKASTHLCTSFTPGTKATYSDKDLNNNCNCIPLVTKYCRPDVYARTLTELGGPAIFKDYVTSQAKWDFTLSIKNIESSESNIKPGLGNFEVKCYMAKAAGVQIGADAFASLTATGNAGLNGGTAADAPYPAGGPPLNLVGDVTFATLPPVDCAAMSKICCIVQPGGGAFTETIPHTSPTTNNKACTTTAITKNCKPVFTDIDPSKTITVNENTGVGASVFQLLYTDANGDTPTTIKFKEAGATNPYFEVDVNGNVKVKAALNFEAMTPALTTQTIDFTVEDADGDGGAISTGKLIINIIDINEKPVLTAAGPPDPITDISESGVKGTGSGATIGIPETYSGDIRTITFTDVDAGDINTISWTKPWTIQLTFPTTGSPTNPFEIQKDALNNGKLSIKPNIIDKEGIAQYRVMVKAWDDGTPQPGGKKFGEIEITVNVLDVNERPQWDTATFKPVNIKEDVNAANSDVITLTAIDVDSPDLIFLMQCNPVTDIFDYTPKHPPPGTGKKMTIKHKATPGFDYETLSSYTCFVFVTDGFNPAVMGTVTINIDNVDEKPKMNLPKPLIPAVYGEISVPELHCYGCHLYDFECTDQDAGQTVTKTFSVYDTPHDLQAKSKFQLDSHGRVLLNFENNILYTRVQEYLTKFTCCSDSTDPKTKCVTQNVTMRVEKMNREPMFRPNSTGITIKENQATTDDLFDVGSKFSDPEGKSPSKCDVLPKRYEKYFTITSNKLRLNDKLDYDTYTPPHHFYISISCGDGGGQTRTDAPDVPILYTEMLVEVNILGVDDNFPIFAPSTYSATVFEDAFSSQSILRVTADDADLGEDGQMIYQVNPNPTHANMALANQLFQIVQISNEVAEIRCRGGLDVEKYSSVVFEVIAVSKPGPKTGTATVTVYIRNVNDLRPQWVTPDYINLEISTTAEVDKLMTTLSCKDTDILYNTVNYDQISVTFGGSDYFKTNVYNGEVRSNHTPYEEDNRYFVRVVCKDTDPKEDFSGIALVRIDTYVNWKHVTNWTMCKPMGNYTAADKDAFLASVATLCPPCIPKIHNITEKDGQAVFHLYFIEDNTTYAKNAQEYDKKFIETDTILERYHNETSNGPKKSVKDDPVFNGCLVNITRFADEPKTSWFLDTIQGNFMLGILMSLAYGLLMAAIICTVRKATPGRMRIPVTPKGRAPKKVNKPQATPKKIPEEKKRPKTPESEYSDESEATYREPTPKITQRKFDKFV